MIDTNQCNNFLWNISLFENKKMIEDISGCNEIDKADNVFEQMKWNELIDRVL